MASRITREVLESYLHCKTKAHLKLAGQQGTVSDYEVLFVARRQEVRQQAIAKILAKHPQAEVAKDIPLTVGVLQSGPPFVLDATLGDDFLSLAFDGLKRVDGASKLGDFHYVPVLFHEGKVGKEQRRLMEIYGLLLSRLQGQMPTSGIIWHGRERRMTRVRLNADLRRTERLLREVKEMVGAESPPRLILNDHCQVCEFRHRCHDQAMQEDNISLLRGMGEKEIKGLARRGIFTLTQLAHTFRPRRKGKRGVSKTHHRYHALQALAIRDKRIYLFGTPQLPVSPVQIYLDVESIPDDEFVYLIGMVIVQGDTEKRVSFWADSKDQEADIFQRFLDEVTHHDNFAVLSYGTYERAFLKRMRGLAGDPKQVDRVLDSLVNVLSLVYAHVYFPCYSNGLKDVARCLGFSWTEPEASGLLSVVWRAKWESTGDDVWQRALLNYNLEDCAALHRVTDLLRGVSVQAASTATGGSISVGGQHVDLVGEIDRWDNNRQWGEVRFAQPEFEQINRCAYFDYQRERIYVRTSTALRKATRRRKKYDRQKQRVTKRFVITSKLCPRCKGTSLTSGIGRKEVGYPNVRAKRAYDLILTNAGVRRKVIECRSSVHRCRDCGFCFVPEAHQRLDRHFHGLKSWAMYQHVVHLISLQGVRDMIEEVFGLRFDRVEVNMFKGLMARYYRLAYDRLLQKILSGTLLLIDETEVRLRTGKGYVWVFASLEEVVYMYRPTREGDFLKEMLKDFHGVLVSDFYAAYDSINCPQQKCMIHLMRDMNQDLLNAPFDEDLKAITQPFGVLLRSAVATIDEHGLKRRHLVKHAGDVQSFFRRLSEQSFQSEAAETLRQRLLKYKDKLFTFIEYDGVPWNNNNAEHAIKAFARYREYAQGSISEKGLGDYLVLLSLYQSCRYRGASFLKFLKSGMRNLDEFCERGRPGRGQGLPAIQLYPKGFTPPHLLWGKKKRRVGKDATEGDDAIEQG
jgi:predicted RecB family nuclease